MAVDYTSSVGNSSYTNEYSASIREATSTASKSGNTLTQADFLNLLTTQLAQQDPTQPFDNNQMITTMSQLSMVENLTTINSNMQGVIDAVTSNSALTASTLVGRSVLVDTNKGYFDGKNPVYCQFDAGEGASNIKVVIKDQNGTVISESDAIAGDGKMQFAWDGVKSFTENEDGTIEDVEFYDPGKYTIEVVGEVNGQATSLPVQMYGVVGSVTLGPTMDTTMLNLIGYGELALSKVEQISI